MTNLRLARTRSVDFLLVCPSLQGAHLKFGITQQYPLAREVGGGWSGKDTENSVAAFKEQRLSVGTGGQAQPSGALPSIEEAPAWLLRWQVGEL